MNDGAFLVHFSHCLLHESKVDADDYPRFLWIFQNHPIVPPIDITLTFHTHVPLPWQSRHLTCGKDIIWYVPPQFPAKQPPFSTRITLSLLWVAESVEISASPLHHSIFLFCTHRTSQRMLIPPILQSFDLETACRLILSPNHFFIPNPGVHLIPPSDGCKLGTALYISIFWDLPVPLPWFSLELYDSTILDRRTSPNGGQAIYCDARLSYPFYFFIL